ncbi:MAG: hypothetical protein QM730_02265 [Anaerolineales bacterium]
MPRPVIFSIDDDPSVLSSVERDLRAQYGKDYRILSIEFGANRSGVSTKAGTAR